MSTTLKCPQGHEWQAGDNDAAPLVCPMCGGAPAGGAVAVIDSESTLDDDRTIDIPTPTPAPRGSLRDDASAALQFAPTPSPASGSSYAGQSLGGTRATDARAAAAAKAAGMPFVIIRQHAKGGLGVVSLARDDQIKREVALKQVLPQHVDNPVLNRRFLYEAQITGQLEHPSIVPVYTLGNDDANHPFYVMRFVKGRTLDQIIQEHHVAPNPIVFRELLRRFIAVCQAVAYAHSRGVIHRDLKPSNIMLGDYGETLVLDWGLAKDIKHPNTDPALWTAPANAASSAGASAAAGTTMVGTSTPNPASRSNQPSSAGASSHGSPAPGTAGTPSAELTMEGQIIGTPAYMAPEQAEGRTELHGPTTDIYALGGILYKILTGKSPQAPTASTTGTMGGRRLTFIPSPPPSKINKDVPEQLEQICVHAMATDPFGRYPRALELAQDIQRWLDEHPLTVRARTSSARVVALLRKHVLLVVGGLTIVAATFAALWLMHLGAK